VRKRGPQHLEKRLGLYCKVVIGGKVFRSKVECMTKKVEPGGEVSRVGEVGRERRVPIRKCIATTKEVRVVTGRRGIDARPI
jgi:hypothetical protein